MVVANGHQRRCELVDTVMTYLPVTTSSFESGRQAVAALGVPTYMPIFLSMSPSGSTTEALISDPMPFNCIIRNVACMNPVITRPDVTETITVRLNGVNTAITFNIPLAQAKNTIQKDTTHEIRVMAGDAVTIKKETTSGANNGSQYNFWCDVEPI